MAQAHRPAVGRASASIVHPENSDGQDFRAAVETRALQGRLRRSRLGKSHFFGELLVETCQAERGTLAVCIREAQRTLAQSSKRLIEGKIASLGLGHGFKLFSDKIETPGDGLIIFRGLQDHTAESIKLLVWDKVFGFGSTEALAGFAATHGQSRGVLLFRQARF